MAITGMRHINLEASISFKSLGKKINNNSALAGVSFGVEKGSIFSVYGKMFSGKSAILKLISGIIYKDKGYLYINGSDLNINPLDIKFDIGYTPQKIDFYNNLNLLDNIILYSEFFNVTKSKAKKRALDLSKRLDILDFLYKTPDETNRCIQKIALFVRSIIHNPNIILLDQLSTDLDTPYKKKIWNFLSKENSTKTIIYSTTDLEEVEKYSNRMLYIDKHEIKYLGVYDTFVESKYNYSSDYEMKNLK